MTVWTLLRRLSLPHLFAARLRSLLIVVGIALGVAVVVASRASSDALQRTFGELVQRVADRADLVVAGAASGVPASLVAEVAAVDGVAHAAAALEITTSFADDGEPLLVLGVDFLGDTHFLPFHSARGGAQVVDDPLSFVNEPDAILLSRTLAQRRRVAVGDRIEVLAAGGTRSLVVRGLIADEGPAASFGGQVAVMFLDAAQLSFERGTLVDRIDVALHDPSQRDAVATRLREMLKGAASVEAPASAVGQRLRSLTGPLGDGMQLSGVLAMLVAVFIIYNAVSIAVVQRRRELGVLRALGVTRRDVVLQLCLEALLLGMVGVLLGLLLARELVQITYVQSRVVATQMLGVAPPPAAITLAHAVRGALAAVVVSVVAAFIPARRGARLDPVAAMRSGSAITARRSVPVYRLTLSGVLLMVLAPPIAAPATMAAGYVATICNLCGAAMCMPLFIVVLRRVLLAPVQRLAGPTGRLGLDYVAQSLGRSTMNVLALMVAVALSLGISGWLRSFESSVRSWFEQVSAADLAVTAGSPIADRRSMPLAVGTLERLRGTPGVAELQPIRLVDERHGDTTLRLLASDTRAYLRQAARRGKPWTVLDGKAPIGESELYDVPQVVLGENAARHVGLRAGDRIELQSPTGPATFEVRAVVVDYSSEVGAVFIDDRYYLERWQDPAVDVINVYLQPGAASEQVAAALRKRLGGGKALFVTATSAVRDEFLRSVDSGFAYARSLELIMLIIAIMGVVGTMVAAVLDRTREIGMLRAVGATRAQVTWALVIESAFLGLCATVGGVVAGSLHTALLLDTVVTRSSGWHLAFAFPYAGVARIALLVIGAGGLSGLLPGLRAARLDIKAALAMD